MEQAVGDYILNNHVLYYGDEANAIKCLMGQPEVFQCWNSKCLVIIQEQLHKIVNSHTLIADAWKSK